MAYKRQIDRLPIIPADAKAHNVVCHYCIVGCGYHACTWDVNRQGGTAPDQNVFGVTCRSSRRRIRLPGIPRPCTTSSSRTEKTFT